LFFPRLKSLTLASTGMGNLFEVARFLSHFPNLDYLSMSSVVVEETPTPNYDQPTVITENNLPFRGHLKVIEASRAPSCLDALLALPCGVGFKSMLLGFIKHESRITPLLKQCASELEILEIIAICTSLALGSTTSLTLNDVPSGCQ
jgi:hypothetical protein